MYRARTGSTGDASPRRLETDHRLIERGNGPPAAELPAVAPFETTTTLVFFYLDLGLSRLTFLNRRVSDFFGYTGVTRECALELLLGKVHPDDLGRVREVITSWTSRTDRPATGDVEFRAEAGHGTWRWMRCRAIVFEPDTEGAAPAILGTAEDVTERRKHKHLSEMATEVAHELSQPLSSIASYALGCSQRLRSVATNREEVLTALERICSEAIRAGQFVHHLRALASDRPPSRGFVDANELARDVAAAVEADAAACGVCIELALAPSLPDIDGDRFQLEHVLLNLVRNALDAIRSSGRASGSTVIRTSPSAAPAGRGIEISISDSGPGVAPNIAPRIFDSQFTTKPNGMGLGLSISRSIVEAHGGTIVVEANDEGGARFRVELPARKSAEDDESLRPHP